jgi:hypothetical protein
LARVEPPIPAGPTAEEIDVRTDSATIELSTRRLLGAAERGAGYLLQNLQPTGRFIARRDARTGRPVTGSYDPTQHFAALWALLDVRGHEPAVQAAAAEGVRWAFDRYYLPTAQGGAFRTNGWLVTGCSGAALLALDELTPERAPAVDLRPEIVDFLLAQQIAEGVLRHDFQHRVALRPFTLDLSRDEVAVHSQTAPQRSSSATGTILSGLVTYLSTLADSLGQDGGADPARFALIYEAVGNALAALCARNYGVRQGPPWMMYAIRRYAELVDRLLVATGQADADLARESRGDLLNWAGRLATGVLAATRDLRCAPTARRVEAQVQFLDLYDSYADELTDQWRWRELTDSARRQVEQDCALLLELQDPESGGFPGSADDPIMQIGHTQHAISALLGAAYAIGG